MQENKISKWLWALVATIDLIYIAYLLMILRLDASATKIQFFSKVILSLICTIIPLLISQSSSIWKDKFKKSYLFLLTIPYIYFIYDYLTCVGKFCKLTPIVFAFVLSTSILVFTLFYAIAEYSLKREAKPILMILLKEILAFGVLVLLFYLTKL